MDASAQESLVAADKAREAGEYDTAKTLYQGLLDVDPESPLAMRGMALVLMWGSGEFEEGVAMLESAAVIAPDSQVVLLELAKSYAMLGQDEEAKPVLDKIVALDPTSREGGEAQNQLQYY